MTERTFFSQSAGPVVLVLNLPIGSVTVQVLDSITTACVELRTADPSGPAADAVSRARSSQDGQAFAVEVPEIPGNVSVRATSAAYGAVRANSVSGDVNVSAGDHLRVSAHSVSGRVCTR
ncbi:hypothetical protein [Streptomyces syringium]|uniref:hypothetical protein n=1 Tax=Streptomyces syringium TaxID=76729 RepID=UPI00343E48FF